MQKRIIFSPVTRLSGLLSIEVFLDRNRVVDANVSSTMFRGFEWIMRNRNITDAVYLTQRVCGICSLAHGAVAGYLVDAIYDNDINENAQYLRNIMLGADFLQNHIRHFYLFSIPDFVKMPERPPFLGQNLTDARLNKRDNEALVRHYFDSIKASQESHQILSLFGGKAPHQHSFVHGGVSVPVTSDNVNQALALIQSIKEFIISRMIPDTQLISRTYNDYYNIGVTPGRLLSFGLFKFGLKNQNNLWPAGVLEDGDLLGPKLELISEDISHSWFVKGDDGNAYEEQIKPNPYKPGAYTWVKSVKYDGKSFQGGPLARMILLGRYRGGTSTMDRIYARSLEAFYISQLMEEWLYKLKPGPAPINQKTEPVVTEAAAITDAMRGPLLHRTQIENEQIEKYNIITPTMWNFSPKDDSGQLGPAEDALIGTVIPKPNMLFAVLGRIVRSFDPCLSCATHVIDCSGNVIGELKI
jgi:hydrogenase large subunit